MTARRAPGRMPALRADILELVAIAGFVMALGTVAFGASLLLHGTAMRAGLI